MFHVSTAYFFTTEITGIVGYFYIVPLLREFACSRFSVPSNVLAHVWPAQESHRWCRQQKEELKETFCESVLSDN